MQSMKIAYLVNQYPLPTHTFVRREILGVEQFGIQVQRISIRDTGSDLPDSSDREEQTKTFAVLGRGAIGILLDVLFVLLANPVAWLRTLVHTYRLGWRSYSGPFRHLIYFAEACTVFRAVRREGSEHIHVHFGTNPTMVAMIVRMLGGPPYSFMIHGPGEWDSPELLHLEEKIRRAEFVTTITDFAQSQAYRWSKPEDWDKIHVVRCGVDQSFLGLEPQAIPETKKIVCVGRLGRSKGHPLLIRAAEQLVREGLDFEILLVGDGELRGLIEGMIAQRNLQDTVKVAGWLDEKMVRQAILESRAMVLPSFGEGLPVVIMEAFALARPVVSTRIAGIPELLREGVNGWLITPGNLDELVSALREVLHVPLDQLFEMGKKGRIAALERHDALREAEKLSKLILKKTSEASAER